MQIASPIRALIDEGGARLKQETARLAETGVADSKLGARTRNTGKTLVVVLAREYDSRTGDQQIPAPVESVTLAPSVPAFEKVSTWPLTMSTVVRSSLTPSESVSPSLSVSLTERP